MEGGEQSRALPAHPCTAARFDAEPNEIIPAKGSESPL